MSTATIPNKTERLIVNILKKSTRPRDYIFVPVILVRDDYNSEDLVNEAKKRGISHKLGYLAELTLITLVLHNFPCDYSKLEYLIQNCVPANQETHLVEKYHQPFVEMEKEQMTSLNKKWGVIINLTENDVNEYLELYVR